MLWVPASKCGVHTINQGVHGPCAVVQRRSWSACYCARCVRSLRHGSRCTSSPCCHAMYAQPSHRHTGFAWSPWCRASCAWLLRHCARSTRQQQPPMTPLLAQVQGKISKSRCEAIPLQHGLTGGSRWGRAGRRSRRRCWAQSSAGPRAAMAAGTWRLSSPRRCSGRRSRGCAGRGAPRCRRPRAARPAAPPAAGRARAAPPSALPGRGAAAGAPGPWRGAAWPWPPPGPSPRCGAPRGSWPGYPSPRCPGQCPPAPPASRAAPSASAGSGSPGRSGGWGRRGTAAAAATAGSGGCGAPLAPSHPLVLPAEHPAGAAGPWPRGWRRLWQCWAPSSRGRCSPRRCSTAPSAASGWCSQRAAPAGPVPATARLPPAVPG